jgi:hypothetical protein
VFHVGVIRQRAVVFDASPAVDHLTVESHRFGQRGLARSRSAEQDDIFDLAGRVRLHNRKVLGL